MKSILTTLVVVAATIASYTADAATPTITGVTAQQRYPWNGKVDISYTVTGDIAAEAKQRAVFTSLKVIAIDKVANTTNIATQLSGDTTLTAGTHKFVWDMNAEGLTFKSSNVVFNVSCKTTPATYCVIDLSAGANATSYPVTYLAAPPSGGFNVDAYKTTKLVLKRLEAGTFKMQGSSNVTLTKPFFCGLFEVTQRQYELVTGSNPCSSTSYGKGNTYPVHYVSYNMIRGSSNGAKWPSSSAVDSSSFMGKLRARTGLDFDLPTEAQWEYACRAGTTTTYSYGNSANGNYMWYAGNSSSAAHPVGSKSANPWGLYDMHGNVWEWCLDWYGTLAYCTDPKGSSSGSDRVRRGGTWSEGVGDCTSSFRINGTPSVENRCVGFRLARTLSN
ncbi:MAG: formylglycine-generating enzyme family protein [Kiritimatiellae bacterium]|nr:formylglycine-generating enzyme family protein [Kiritimatiellia bacterium]